MEKVVAEPAYEDAANGHIDRHETAPGKPIRE